MSDGVLQAHGASPSPGCLDLDVGEGPAGGIPRVLGLPQARLHREPTADGLTKAVGGRGQHDPSFRLSKRYRRLPKALEVDGDAGQVPSSQAIWRHSSSSPWACW